MDNFIKPGKVLTFTAPMGGVTAGVPVLIGSLLVVPAVSADADEQFEGVAEGVVSYTKTSAQAWTEGQRIYWNGSTDKFDSDSTTGPLVGVAAAAADNPSGTGEVRLNGAAPGLAEGAQTAVVTLTDSTGGSGTHDDTLAAPSVPADITGGESPTEAEHNAALAAMRIINQNTSDLAQKIIEIRTALVNAGVLQS